MAVAIGPLKLSFSPKVFSIALRFCVLILAAHSFITYVRSFEVFTKDLRILANASFVRLNSDAGIPPTLYGLAGHGDECIPWAELTERIRFEMRPRTNRSTRDRNNKLVKLLEKTCSVSNGFTCPKKTRKCECILEDTMYEYAADEGVQSLYKCRTMVRRPCSVPNPRNGSEIMNVTHLVHEAILQRSGTPDTNLLNGSTQMVRMPVIPIATCVRGAVCTYVDKRIPKSKFKTFTVAEVKDLEEKYMYGHHPLMRGNKVRNPAGGEDLSAVSQNGDGDTPPVGKNHRVGGAESSGPSGAPREMMRAAAGTSSGGPATVAPPSAKEVTTKDPGTNPEEETTNPPRKRLLLIWPNKEEKLTLLPEQEIGAFRVVSQSNYYCLCSTDKPKHYECKEFRNSAPTTFEDMSLKLTSLVALMLVHLTECT